MAEPRPSPHRHRVLGLRGHKKPAPLIWSRIDELFLPYEESRMNLHDPVSRWRITLWESYQAAW